jgi:hypothetical protein
LAEELEGLLRNANLNTALQAEPNQSQGIPTLFEDLDIIDINPLSPHQDLSFGQPHMMHPTISDVPQESANQLINLGLFEQLPSFEVIDEL